MAGIGQVNNRKPYNGDRRALVLAFDVGTTFSGVSYAFLEPGEVPKIHGVTRYPGQEHVTGNTKIPSLLYYDRSGKVVAAGAEAETGQIADLAEDEGWYKVELFKLRLRPRRMQLDMNGMRLSPLPPGKSSEDVFGDFLAYLFSCTRKFIEDTHANGKNLWHVVENDIHFVLSHPNGWEGAQQTRMRRAAISGGLIPNTDEGKARIRFVTEGEASMHACILSGLAHDVLASGNGFVVADAGGGTLDVSSYILRGTHPLQIEEVAPPDCVFSGAVFVSRRCRVFLEEKLRNSRYGSPDILDHITKRFDETTKRLFRDKHDPQYIQFGSPLDKDLKVGIRGGQLKLMGSEVAELFEPSIEAAVASIRKQIELSHGAVKAVWLVGGFAASSWLFSQLQKRLAPLGVTVNRPDSQTSKAVADGAIGFFCDHHVSARMSRYMYGVEYLREIDVNDEEHIIRSGRQLQLPSGPKYLPDAFDCILAKNVRVKESSVFSRKYYTEVTKPSTLSVFEIEIWCYRGGETIPKWIDRNSDQFGSLCFVRADLSRLSSSAEPKRGANGQTYYTVVFSIEIHFGLTEFKARMKWNEDGKTRYGPATIVYNEKGVRSDEDDDAYSVAGGDESMSVSPRRPYGSLLSHSSREPSSTSRSTRHRERDRDRGLQRGHSHRARAPSLSATGMSRSMSGQTDATSVETVVREPSPPPLSAPPVTSSVSGSVRRSSRSRGLGSTAPSAHEFEPEPTLERELQPSVHSRVPSVTSPPSMHSRPPSVSAPMSTHSRAPSTVVPPSIHSRTPSVAPPPSMHSRAPSAAAPPSVYSRTPSAAAPPSMHSRAPSMAQAPSVVHSRTPSVAPAASPVASRAPSAAPVPSRAPSGAAATPPVVSRAPSAAPAASPVPSRAPSSGSRPSVSRAPSSGSRVPSVTRQASARSGPASRAPSQMEPVDEGDLYVPTEPDVSGAAAEYFNAPRPPSDGLDATHTRSRSISPAPPATAAPAEEGWEIPSVSVVPPEAEKKDKQKGWGFGGVLGSMFGANGKPAEDGIEPLAAPGDVPLAAFGNAEEPFVPPVPGGVAWNDVADAPSAPGGWEADPLAPESRAPAPAPEPEPAKPEPEITAPPVGKTASSRSTGSKGKKPKGILKNGSASSKAAEAEAKAKAKAEAEAQERERERERAEAEAREKAEAEARARAEAEELARWQAEEARAEAREKAEAEARARAEAEERARQQAEEARVREQEEMERRARELAERQAREREEAERKALEARLQYEAEQRAREEEEARLEAELAQIEREEAENRARAEAEQAEGEAREREEAEARAKAEAEEKARAAAEAEARATEEEAAAKAKADAEAAEAAAHAQAQAQAEAQAEADANANAAETGADDSGEPSANSAPAPAIDKEKVKLEAAVEKAEKDLEKAEQEVDRCGAAVTRAQGAGAKGGKKKSGNKAKPSAGVQAVERNLTVAEKARDTAKEKLEKAKEALAAHVGQGGPEPEPTPGAANPEPTDSTPAHQPGDPAPPISKNASTASGKGKKGKKGKKATTLDNDDEENEGAKTPGTPAENDTEPAPPISKASSNANGKGKSTFSFAALGNDDDGEKDDDAEGAKDGEGITDGLIGSGGSGGWGGWGFSSQSFGGGGNNKGNAGWLFDKF